MTIIAHFDFLMCDSKIARLARLHLNAISTAVPKNGMYPANTSTPRLSSILPIKSTPIPKRQHNAMTYSPHTRPKKGPTIGRKAATRGSIPTWIGLPWKAGTTEVRASR